MSNVAIFNPSQLPAFARKGEMSAVAKALAGGAAQTGKRLSIKGSVFRLIVDGKEVGAMDERFLDVVIVNAAPKVSRTYYEGAYDENKAAAPKCWSQDGDKPDASIKQPMHSNCANCPMNAKGSGQGDSRACRFSQRLAVVLANDVEGDVLQLSLAATSIFGKAEGDNRPLQEYSRWLIAQGVDPTQVVTRLKFDTKAPVPKLFFRAMRWLTDDEFATTQEKGQSEDAIKAITMTVSQTDGVGSAVAAPAPFAGTPPKAKAAAAPAPAADEDDEEAPPPAPKAKAKKAAPAPAADDEDNTPEPTVRAAAAKPAASVPAASGLAQTLSDWDDE